MKTDILVYWLKGYFPLRILGEFNFEISSNSEKLIRMSFVFAFISVSSSSTYVVRKDDSWYFLGWHPPISCRLNPPGPGLLPRSLFQRRCGNILWSGLSLSRWVVVGSREIVGWDIQYWELRRRGDQPLLIPRLQHTENFKISRKVLLFPLQGITFETVYQKIVFIKKLYWVWLVQLFPSILICRLFWIYVYGCSEIYENPNVKTFYW